jgi:hypothetical protein
MCKRDGIPIGVLIQTSDHSPASYAVLGLASVAEWSNGFFLLVGRSSIDNGE